MLICDLPWLLSKSTGVFLLKKYPLPTSTGPKGLSDYESLQAVPVNLAYYGRLPKPSLKSMVPLVFLNLPLMLRSIPLLSLLPIRGIGKYLIETRTPTPLSFQLHTTDIVSSLPNQLACLRHLPEFQCSCFRRSGPGNHLPGLCRIGSSASRCCRQSGVCVEGSLGFCTWIKMKDPYLDVPRNIQGIDDEGIFSSPQLI